MRTIRRHALEHLIISALCRRWIGVPARQIGGSIIVEDLEQIGAPVRAALVDDIGLRAEGDDIDQVVEPIDWLRHEQGVRAI